MLEYAKPPFWPAVQVLFLRITTRVYLIRPFQRVSLNAGYRPIAMTVHGPTFAASAMPSEHFYENAVKVYFQSRVLYWPKG